MVRSPGLPNASKYLTIFPILTQRQYEYKKTDVSVTRHQGGPGMPVAQHWGVSNAPRERRQTTNVGNDNMKTAASTP